jgi:hypothetical protein
VKDVGHRTNALPADKVREKGAEWTFGGKKKEQWASWTTAVPDGATHLEVIMVYTDTIYGPGHVNGDLPLIIGSFSGELTEGKWTIKPNTNDVFKPVAKQPREAEFPKLLAVTRKILMDKTGYMIQARPAGLKPGIGFIEGNKVINKAREAKKIGSELDTGYDIVPR